MTTSSVTPAATAGINTSALMTAAGIGSGIDVNSMVSQLMAVEQQPVTLLQQQQASYQTQVSALGTLQSAVATLQSAMQALANPATFQTLSAISSNTSVLSAAAGTTTAPGNYAISVGHTAQAQALAATGLASQNNPSSTGTLTIQVGAGAATTVTIDSSNNTLAGVASAINAANAGVSASIINDGSATPYRLVLSANAGGSANTISVINNLAAGELHDAIAGLTEVVPPQDATLTVNGVAITSASNTVTGAIPGVTLNLQATGSTTLTVAPDSSTIQANVNNLVNAYNVLNSTIGGLTSYDATTKTASPLTGDFTAQNLLTQVRSILSQSLSGMGGGPNTLSQIGVTFQRDGSLALDSTKLGNVINNNFSSLAGLFGVQGTSSNSLLSFVSAGAKSQPGTYQVNITAAAAQGSATANNAAAASTVIDASNDGFAMTIDGVASGTVTLPHGTYTPAQLAAAVQSALNGAAALTAAGVSANVTVGSGGNLIINAQDYGTQSTVADASGTAAAALGFDGTESGAGTDVAGNFVLNGQVIAATGAGQLLTGAAGTAADGLKAQYIGGPAQVATGANATFNFSQGFATQLYNFTTNALDTTGAIASEQNGINNTIQDINNQISDLNTRLAQVQANYMAEFTALDTLIASMNQTSSYLTTQLANLPLTQSSSSK
jgi:flagellar hook-associated protein 2